jgi:hypothetical protein
MITHVQATKGIRKVDGKEGRRKGDEILDFSNLQTCFCAEFAGGPLFGLMSCEGRRDG